MDEFLAALGQELRNALAPVLTALHLIKLRGGDPYERERAIVHRQVEHVTRMIDDLLDISRIRRGSIQLRRAPVELAWIVARAVDLTSPIVAERGHRVIVAVLDNGLSIDADLDRLTQVVANLVVNAAKDSPRAARIEIVGDIEGGCARLVVRDYGAGITPARLPSLFDVLDQGGLGLGLSIVRGIVELHGGVVSAASEGPGRGATFTVRLPLAGTAEIETVTLDEPVSHDC
jgi:signal transduction histidine kinase